MPEQPPLFSAVEYAETELVSPEFYRADGDCLCPACGRQYREHPWDEENLSAIGNDFDGDALPYLRILCNGDLEPASQ